ncbi:AarF/UbiB family protein [Oleiagrimonas sp. C23AA]|uniref:ABC1 kinase family protein n=1 Tax=Oleiagrimonas sp. C23AA TaxID=2719047 RepID=UPI0031B6F626
MPASRTWSRYAHIAHFMIKYRKAGLFDGLDLEIEDTLLGAEHGSVPPGKPEQFVDDLEALGPTFIKIGQVLSTRPDMVPAPYLSALERMQDSVAPVPVEQIRKVIEDELGVRINRAFASFDDVPLAAGSMAQVHTAVLRDGTEVAIKVQRPGIAETIREDLGILSRLAGAADRLTEMGRRYGFSDWVHELRRSLANEIDFEMEAENLRTFAERLRPYPRLCVPTPFADLTTSRVLTMERVRGVKVTQIPPVQRLEKSLTEHASELLRAYLDQVFVHGLVHADPHPGNVLLNDADQLALIDLGMVARLPPRTRGQVLKLMLGAIDGNGEQVCEISESLGTVLEDFRAEDYRREVAQLVSGYAGMHRGAHAYSEGRMMLELTRVGAACGLRPPPELSLLGKTLLNLESVVDALEPALNARGVVERHLQKVLRRQALHAMSPPNLASEMLDMQELARHTPQHVAAILRTLAENRMRVRIDGLEESRMMENLQKIANRIAAGVIVAALVIGAALMGSHVHGPTWFGYPALAVIFLIVAALLGVALVISSLRRDRDVRQLARRRRP